MRISSWDLTGLSKGSGDEINYEDCPICRAGRRWHFYANRGTGLYYCFETGVGGKLSDIATSGMAPVPVRDWHWDPIGLPTYMYLTSCARQYLKERGFDANDATRFGLRESHFERILIPYFDSFGEIIYWAARAYGLTHPKYLFPAGIKKPLYVPVSSFAGPTFPLIVCEGQFDAMALVRDNHGQGVALGGKTLPAHNEWPFKRLAQDFERVVVMLDGDAMSDALSLQQRLQDLLLREIEAIFLDDGEDPASVPREKLKDLLR